MPDAADGAEQPCLGNRPANASPMNDMMSLNTPINTIAAMPTCQATIAASSVDSFVLAARNAGPSTVSAMPIVDGASSPRGIAVTSSRPVRRASRIAITV